MELPLQSCRSMCLRHVGRTFKRIIFILFFILATALLLRVIVDVESETQHSWELLHHINQEAFKSEEMIHGEQFCATSQATSPRCWGCWAWWRACGRRWSPSPPCPWGWSALGPWGEEELGTWIETSFWNVKRNQIKSQPQTILSDSSFLVKLDADRLKLEWGMYMVTAQWTSWGGHSSTCGLSHVSTWTWLYFIAPLLSSFGNIV